LPKASAWEVLLLQPERNRTAMIIKDVIFMMISVVYISNSFLHLLYPLFCPLPPKGVYIQIWD
jgi:hypothetical protein